MIFDNELKPVQAYNLAKETGVEAIDRFQLILEIFAKRASTSEAKLQIQLAKLRYELPRAKEKVKLARMIEQPGFMGLGKYEVDPYYENVRRGISSIREKLKRIRKKRRLHRAHRLELGFSSVSLAGYTKFNPIYSPEGISPSELKRIQRKAMREFYLRPARAYRLIKCMKSFDQFKTYVKGFFKLITS